VADLSGVGTGELHSAQTAALYLTQFPAVVGAELAGQLLTVAQEIRAELETRPREGLIRHLREVIS